MHALQLITLLLWVNMFADFLTLSGIYCLILLDYLCNKTNLIRNFSLAFTSLCFFNSKDTFTQTRSWSLTDESRSVLLAGLLKCSSALSLPSPLIPHPPISNPPTHFSTQKIKFRTILPLFPLRICCCFIAFEFETLNFSSIIVQLKNNRSYILLNQGYRLFERLWLFISIPSKVSNHKKNFKNFYGYNTNYYWFSRVLYYLLPLKNINI